MFGFGGKTADARPALDEEPVLVSHDDVPGGGAKKPARKPPAAAEVLYDLKEEDATPLFSGACLLVYVGVWISSLLSPVIVVTLYLLGWYVLLTLVLGIVAAAFLPDEMLPKAEGMRRFFEHHNPRYFKNTSLRMEAPLDPAKPTMVCFHPHGIFCLGWGQFFLQEATQHVHFCFSNILYFSPFFRLFSRMLGKPAGVDKATLQGLMKKGESLALIPGGFEDATLHCPSADRTFLKSRKGFVKYALKYGYSLTPVFSMGERESFDNVQGHYDFRFKLNALGVPAIVPWGLSVFPLLPKRCNIHIVVGKPLQLPKIASPSVDDVNKHHQLYMEHLKVFYNRHKTMAYGEGAPDLEIW